MSEPLALFLDQYRGYREHLLVLIRRSLEGYSWGPLQIGARVIEVNPRPSGVHVANYEVCHNASGARRRPIRSYLRWWHESLEPELERLQAGIHRKQQLSIRHVMLCSESIHRKPKRVP
jgi:hypothetical protein